MNRDTRELAEHARRTMVEALSTSASVGDPTVLAAMGRVAREAFVPRFWTSPSSAGPPGTGRSWSVDDDQQAEGTVQLLYDIDRALAIRSMPTGEEGAGIGPVTSTASAPRIVGSMLELLDLRPGMRVLEIGTGSGYNTALLRELVGPGGLVASLDIDAELVVDASAKLEAAGYPDVHVVAADGYFGLAERAPFDRVVATVGSLDLAPAWLDQLGPGGLCLVPLAHGGWHPLMLTGPMSPAAGVPADVAARGTVVGRSSFVAIQGRQQVRSPWSHAGLTPTAAHSDWTSLPEELARSLRPGPEREAIGALAAWDLAYLVALEDRRAAQILGLADDDGSGASIDPVSGRLEWSGVRGSQLSERLIEITRHWMALGRPGLADYTSNFTRRAHHRPQEDAETKSRRSWAVDRVDHRQTVEL